MRENSLPRNGDIGVTLPCLYSNISIERPVKLGVKLNGALYLQPEEKPENILSTQHKKAAFALQESITELAKKYGIEHLGFLTLTFADHVTEHKEASRRFNSLSSNVLKDRYQAYIGVIERQKSGRLHYHLLVVLDDDIRTGVDFAQLKKGNYSSAGPALRKEWSFWRITAKKYKFGRTELLPVKSNTSAISKYVGKYIAKHIDSRRSDDKGARLVRYSANARTATTRFQFVTEGSAHWRRKLATFAAIVQAHNPETEIDGIDAITKLLGPRWAYKHREYIMALD